MRYNTFQHLIFLILVHRVDCWMTNKTCIGWKNRWVHQSDYHLRTVWINFKKKTLFKCKWVLHCCCSLKDNLSTYFLKLTWSLWKNMNNIQQMTNPPKIYDKSSIFEIVAMICNSLFMNLQSVLCHLNDVI